MRAYDAASRSRNPEGGEHVDGDRRDRTAAVASERAAYRCSGTRGATMTPNTP